MVAGSSKTESDGVRGSGRRPLKSTTAIVVSMAYSSPNTRSPRTPAHATRHDIQLVAAIATTVLTALGCGSDDSGSKGDAVSQCASCQDGADGAQLRANSSGNANVDVDVTASTQLNLNSCTAGFTDREVAEHTELAFDLEASMHEMVACGGLTVSMSAALITGVIGMVFDPSGAIIPSGLRYEGAGVYHTGGGLGSSVSMDIRLYERVDGEFHLVEADLFDADSYLVGVDVDADASAGIDFDITDPLGTKVNASAKLEATYESAGPWAKLLGLGNPPPNPLHLTDLADIDPDFGGIYIESDVSVTDTQGNTDIEFRLRTGKQSLNEVFGSGSIGFELIELHASNGSLDQTLTVSDFAVGFAGGNRLDGNVTFEVEGDAMAYAGALTYEEAAFADVTLSCL